jgi:hypothetical protein
MAEYGPPAPAHSTVGNRASTWKLTRYHTHTWQCHTTPTMQVEAVLEQEST